RFDRLVRSFGQTRSRRQTLRGLAGAAATGALALSGREASADLCKSTGKACKTDSQCCSGLSCVGPSPRRNNSPKKSTATCQPNTCFGFHEKCSPVGTAVCCDPQYLCEAYPD